ncbi:MAG TPA: hypothetical protein VLM11_01060 [Streptosporangiaceae bacterium]|nr:hypothetical protein [Streptosporangiaceae bacterium]
MSDQDRPGAAVSHSASAPGPDEPTDDERAELQRLRDEVLVLRQREAGRSRRRPRWRTPVAIGLIVLGCILAPLSVLGVWAANQISNTDRYVANMSPLISEPEVQRALTDRLSNALTTRLDVQGLVRQAAASLTRQGATTAGTLLTATSGPIASGVDGFVHSQIGTFVASPQAARLWTQANLRLHTQLVKVLSGQSGSPVTVVNGQAVLNLGPLIDQARKNLAAKGLTVVNKIPPVNPTYPLFPSKYLVRAQGAYQLLNTLKIVLAIVTVVFLGLGVYVARNHRRALIGVGLGVAASMLVLAAVLAIMRSVYLGALPASASADAATDVYNTLIRFIQDGLRTILAVALIVALGAFITGPSVTAVRTRGAIASGLGWVRASGERAGLRTGPIGAWTYRYRTGLRISAVVLAALIFVFWSQPTALVALVIALILLAVLGFIELIGRPPAAPASRTAGEARSGSS